MLNVRATLKNGIAQLREADVASFTLAAELLLLHVLGRNRTWLYAHPEEPIADPDAQLPKTTAPDPEADPVQLEDKVVALLKS